MANHVRLTQLDGKLPNLALMRLSAWHKARGDEVYFTRSPFRQLGEPDYAAVYGSAIFRFSAARVERLKAEWPSAVIGGTWDEPLAHEPPRATPAATIEAIPGFFDCGADYSLYPEFTASIGFTQRGCRQKCKFCVVPAREGKPKHAAVVGQVWRGDPHPRHLHLLDNDFFGGPQWQDRIAEIRDGDFRVCFSQGINVRAVTDEAAEALASIKYRDDSFSRSRLYTAWDNLKDEGVFFRGVDTLERHGVPARNLMVYMLIGFDKHETWDRIWHRFNRMVERGIKPYPMVFDPARKDLKRFQRWVVTGIYRAGIPFDEYDASARRPNGSGATQIALPLGAAP